MDHIRYQVNLASNKPNAVDCRSRRLFLKPTPPTNDEKIACKLALPAHTPRLVVEPPCSERATTPPPQTVPAQLKAGTLLRRICPSSPSRGSTSVRPNLSEVDILWRPRADDWSAHILIHPIIRPDRRSHGKVSSKYQYEYPLMVKTPLVL